MKTLSSFLLIFFMLSCESISQNNSSHEATSTEKVVESPSAGNPCTKMAFFQKGAEIHAKTYDSTGAEVSSQLTKVIEVSRADGFLVARVEGVNTDFASGNATNVTFSYKCNGKSVFFDIASMYRTEAKNQDSSFRSGEFELPLNLKVGETLPDIRSTMESEKAGKKMAMTFQMTNRKVETTEPMSTEAGTWQCFRISDELKVSMDLPGMDPKMKEMIAQLQSQNKMTTITWFAPDVGLVKTEVYKNGKLESSNRIVSIKK